MKYHNHKMRSTSSDENATPIDSDTFLLQQLHTPSAWLTQTNADLSNSIISNRINYFL